MSESKAEAEGMADKNGRTGTDRFTIVTDQLKTAPGQLRAGRNESASDAGSVALNEALAETSAVTGATPSPQRSYTEPSQPPITIPRGNGLNGNHERGSRSGASSAIDLVSNVTDAAPARRSARSAGSIINLQTGTIETPILRPSRSSRLVVGSAGARPKEPPVDRVGEAFPEHPDEDSIVNGAVRLTESTESTLGMFLLASRERHGVKREEAACETRIPLHYLRMMESNDYAMIADQLYLLPFLRRYADYLGLDSEEIAIRFVREVQRAENSPSPASASISSDSDSAPSNRWAILGAIAVIALIAVWVVLQRRHASSDAASATQSAAAIPASDVETDAGANVPEALPPTSSQPVASASLVNPPFAAAAPAMPKRALSGPLDTNAPVPPGGTE